MNCAALLCLVVAEMVGLPAAGPSSNARDPAAEIPPAVKQPDGLLVHTVRSPYQAGPTHVRVLLPDRIEPDARYRVLYVLPVEAGEQSHYGDGLSEIKKRGLHNRHRLICVAPTFSHLPWYADHLTDPQLRQESYFLKVVLPLVERTYPVREGRQGRLLLGFSKSGWGAWSLLLRHPQVFDRAAAWDAPLMEDRPGRFGMGPIFGTQENFDRYRIASLLRRRADELRGEPPRLVLTGYGNFRQQHRDIHRRLTEIKIPHIWRDGPPRKHDWHSGWVAEAVGLLAAQKP